MIDRCREDLPVRMMCRLLQVSASGYYARHTRGPSQRTQANTQLLKDIRAIHAASDGIYGSPKMWDELRGQGQRCGKHRVARLMKSEGLQGIPQGTAGKVENRESAHSM